MTNATQERIGVLRSNSPSNPSLPINIRSGPATTASVKLSKPPGTRVTVIDSNQPPGDRYLWYRVRYGNRSDEVGWVRADVIELLPVNPPPPDVNTRLYFETSSRQVRVYGTEPAYMNVYVKESNVTDLNRVLAVRVPKTGSDERWKSYIAVKDGKAYQVRFLPLTQTQAGQAELIIGDSSDGRIFLQEKGFAIEGSEYNRLNAAV